MNIDEWISIGYKNGIINDFDTNNDFSMSFCDVYKLWISSKIGKIRPQSIDRIEVTYNKYYRDSFLGALNPLTIDTDIIIKFFRQYEVNRKEYSRIRQILFGVFDYLVINDYSINSINWKKVENFIDFCKTIKKKQIAVSRCDVDRLFSCVVEEKVHFKKQSGCLLLLLNFSLGLRIGELAVLTWDCVDFSRRLIYVNKSAVKYYCRNSDGDRISSMKYDISLTKTDNGIRCVPLSDRAIYILRLLVQHHENMGYKSKFLAYDGQDVVFVRSLDRTLRRLCKLCKVEYFESHRIRKTFASNLHDAGISTKKISFLLGHSDIVVTQKNYILDTFESLDQLCMEISKVV